MTSATNALAKAVVDQPQLPVWICHMWQRLKRRKLGLILGAGVSVDGGCPTWNGLVQRLEAREPKITAALKAHREKGVQDITITQILYAQHNSDSKELASSIPVQFRQYQIDSTWMEKVHEDLYRDIASSDFDAISKRHSYLAALGQLVCRTELTVNFNFDDLVDEAAINFSKSRHREQPEIIHKPKIETRLDAPVIYHINGYLPREARRRRSESLVFTEDAFADVLISPTSHDSDFLMSRFATTTFLLLGTSLNDNSLKNMLRAGMKRSPANHHYMVYWDDPASLRSQDEKRHIFEVNLEVYNLISIFLSTSQILELIEMLNEENEAIFEAAILKFSSLVTRRRYYLVGSVVAGKSTSLEALRCFATFEEWFGRPPQVMYQDHKTLSPAERTEVDDWLYTQLREKNDRMRSTGVGIHIMDRGFLDLCAFSETGDENQKKLKEMRERVCRVSGPLENGQIIYLYAQEVVLSERQARRGKLRGPSKSIDYDGAALVQQDKALREIYRPGSSSVYDTSHQSADRISRRIAREILLGEYHPFNFEGRIDEILANGGNL